MTKKVPFTKEFEREAVRLGQTSGRIGYVARHALDGSLNSGKAMCGVVRAFLRYLHLKGLIPMALADCVPAFQHS